MSEIQEIDVFVRPDGTVRIEVRGVKGEGCLSLTEAVEKRLGGSVLSREHTDEMAQAAEAGQERRLDQGR